MNRCDLIIVIHNHQPVGNFDHVIEEAYRRAYLPFLEVLEGRPEVRIGLHNSGCLWEWLEERHPEYGVRIERLVRAGRIELFGGGFYEPILPTLPSRDRRGQIARMRSFLEERFGVTPTGAWLAERVWETHLTADLAAEGVEYLCLDDSQFHEVGIEDQDLSGYYLTEDSGLVLGLYPIQMRLRYEIPFALPERVVETLRESADERPGTMRLFGDDGEKFGIWPGTHKLCYEERWLDRFFDCLEGEREWLRLVLPREHRAGHPPRGRIYLPAGSYREMTEWALPAPAQILFEETRGFLREHGKGEAERLFLRGGFFRNFLVRYAESNQMHKRALLAHGALDRAGAAASAVGSVVRDHFWRAQCNCAYWHGVFGGLYLPHLRDGIYRELIKGERTLDRALRGEGAWVEAETIDYDNDGEAEAILRSDRLALFLSPRRGGGLLELDDRIGARNLVNTLTRRFEPYHARLAEAGGPETGAAQTIHERITSKEEHLERFLLYDARERVALDDRFFLEDPPRPEDLMARGGSDTEDFAGRPYRLEGLGVSSDRSLAEAVLSREGTIGSDPARRIVLTKSIRLRAGHDSVEVAYRIRSLEGEPFRVSFGTEWVVNLLAGDAPDRYVLVDGALPDAPHLAGAAVHRGAGRLSLVDRWSGAAVDLRAEGAAGWVRAPVETVSLSEAGAERVFQGTIALPYWDLFLMPHAEWEGRVVLEIVRGDRIEEIHAR